MSKETDRLQQQVEELQDDLKVLKNEIKGTLTDIREYLLTGAENPFPVGTTSRSFPYQNNSQSSNGHSTQTITPEQAAPTALLESPAPASNPVDLGALLNNSLGASAPAQGSTQWQPQSSPMAAGFPAGFQMPAFTPAPQSAPADAGLLGLPASMQPQIAEPEASAAASPSAGYYEEPQLEAESQTGHQRSYTEEMEATPVESETQSNGISKNVAAQKASMPDLTSLSLLAPWVEESVRKVGKDRLKSIMEIYSSMNGLTPTLKETITQLIDLEEGEGPAGKASLKKCLRVLADLDSLVWRSQFDRTGIALLNAYLNGSR